VQFVRRCRRQNQGVALALENLPEIVGELFVFREIEDEISVERELLLWRCHKSSPLPR
jgi:hypothetical protein